MVLICRACHKLRLWGRVRRHLLTLHSKNHLLQKYSTAIKYIYNFNRMNVLLPKKMDLTYKVKFIDPHSFIIKYFIYIKKNNTLLQYMA